MPKFQSEYKYVQVILYLSSVLGDMVRRFFMKISSAAFDAEYSIGAPTLFDDATEEVKIWDDLYS